MSSQLPAWHLYCGDLWKDNGFRLCGWQSQNLWLRMLILLHEQTPRGEFRLHSGEPMTDEQVAKLCEMPVDDFLHLTGELHSNGVFSRIAGSIANRRMVRERELIENKVKAGIAGSIARWQTYSRRHSKEHGKVVGPTTTYSSSSSSSSSISKDRDTVSWREHAQQVWNAFPRNNRKVGKGAVWKWFERHKPTDEVVIRMCKALSALQQTEQWKKEGGKFIPLPMTWLNQGRWEDEVLPEVQGINPPPPPPKIDPIARGLWKQRYGDPKQYGYD